MKLNQALGRLRLLAILEGISFLLFSVTMPLKYLLGIPEPNFIVGMAHGWLFILYVVFCVECIFKYGWSFRVTSLALLASLIPFGTFVANAKIFRPQEEKELMI